MGPSLLIGSLALVLAGCGGNKGNQIATPPPQAGDTNDAPPCEPGRCLEDISRLIGERRPDARACYDAGRKRDATMEGKIIINFAIDSEGVVGEASQGVQDGQIEDQEVVGCVTEVILTVRFAASPTGRTTRAYHRFEFTP